MHLIHLALPMLIIALVAAPADALDPPRVALLTGQGSGGGWSPSVTAVTSPAGTMGSGSVCPAGCSNGNIVEVVPPAGATPHWCVTWERSDAPNQFTSFYVRETVGAPDQFSFVSGFGVSCARFPNPLGSWLSLQTGDFVGLSVTAP